jgi:RND family efflux transporter MFP subunit
VNGTIAATSEAPLHSMAFRVQWRWALLVAAAIAAVSGYVWYPAAKGRGIPAGAPATVRPISRDIESVVTTSGTVRLRTGAVVRVGSQVSGIIQRLNVTVGSRVERGGVIAIVDPTAPLARLDQAKAQIEIDRVARDKAARDLDRVRNIAPGLIPAQQVEDLRWAVQLANARVTKSEADLRAAAVELSYTTIHAPISGTVASVSTQQGETVAASFSAPTFVTIVDDSALELVAMVDETDIAGVAPGQAIRFSVEAYPGRDFGATVRRIDPTATIISGVINYAVIAQITGGVNDLKPDMTANIVITKTSRQALFLPQSAVYDIGDRHYVDVLRGDTPQRQAVVVGNRDAGLLEVSGITAEDTVRLTGAAPAAQGGRP